MDHMMFLLEILESQDLLQIRSAGQPILMNIQAYA